MTTRLPGPPEDGLYVVVGASGAVGQAVVRRLVGQGRQVLALARDKEALDALAGGELVTACAVDIGSDDAIDQIAGAVDRPVALALFTAGLPVSGSVEAMEPSALAGVAGLKAAGVARLLRGVRERLVAGSRFLAIAGLLGFEPGPYDAAPGTANAALVNLMRQIAQLYGPRGVSWRPSRPAHSTLPGCVPSPRRAAPRAAARRPRCWPSTRPGRACGTCQRPTSSPG